MSDPRAADQTLSQQFGEQVRQAREQLGMSQEELGERIGTLQPHISRIESGTINPTLPACEQIAAALGAKISISLRLPPRRRLRQWLAKNMS